MHFLFISHFENMITKKRSGLGEPLRFLVVTNFYNLALQKQVRTSDCAYGVPFVRSGFVWSPMDSQWILYGSGRAPKGIEFRV